MFVDMWNNNICFIMALLSCITPDPHQHRTHVFPRSLCLLTFPELFRTKMSRLLHILSLMAPL